MGAYQLLSDQELLVLLKEGDHAAYTQLYDRYFEVLFLYAYKKLRDEEEAKDIIHEFFTALWLKKESITFTKSLDGYCFTAINNRIIDFFLHKQVETKYITSFFNFITNEESKTDHPIREKQLAALIEKEIQDLPAKMREVFELSRNANLTYKEIAEKLSISEKTVHRQMSNALHRLRTKLGIFIFLFILMKL